MTGQMTGSYWTTRGLPTRRLPTRGLDDSRTGQLADWTTRECHRRLCVLSFPFWRHLRDRELSSPRLVQSASCLVLELSSPRVDQSARCPVRELAYPRVVQLPNRTARSVIRPMCGRRTGLITACAIRSSVPSCLQQTKTSTL